MARAHAAGVDRVGIDLDTRGKAERQRGLGTWISPHRPDDLPALAGSGARLFARVNPPHGGTRREVERVLELGAEVVMLPMVASAHEAERFAALVDGRATVVLLVERHEALTALGEMVGVAGVDEVHIGINDLALSLRLRNRWDVLAGDIPLRAGSVVREAGLRFGLGGIGRAGDASLPVPSDLVYAEYARTGATAALLARSFGTDDLGPRVRGARAALARWHTVPAQALDEAHAELARCAARVRRF